MQDPNTYPEVHTGQIFPDSGRHESIRFVDAETAQEFKVLSITETGDPTEPKIAAMAKYGPDGGFIDIHEVIVPSRIQEARQAVFEFTKRHKRVVGGGTAGVVIGLVAVGTLRYVLRRSHK